MIPRMRFSALVVALLFVGCRHGFDVASLFDVHLESGAPHQHGGAPHTHGDSDDRHEDGDTDCNHEHHCCCQHVSPLDTGSASTAARAGAEVAVSMLDHSPFKRPAGRLIFHPPIR